MKNDKTNIFGRMMAENYKDFESNMSNDKYRISEENDKVVIEVPFKCDVKDVSIKYVDGNMLIEKFDNSNTDYMQEFSCEFGYENNLENISIFVGDIISKSLFYSVENNVLKVKFSRKTDNNLHKFDSENE